MTQPSHFKGRDAIGHVAEAQAKGIISAAEIHGTELPGHISAGADAARDTAMALLLFWVALFFSGVVQESFIPLFLIFGVGWLIWKAGRSSWLAWLRLERLHRVISQEKWEIEHHRQQERDELRVLYAAKGFEGKLLEDVLDVLMADGDRLLRVMVEEELGLTLEVHEHPLKQGVGAAIGALIAILIVLASYLLSPPYGPVIGALLAVGLSAALAAKHEQNRLIPAIVWSGAIAILALGFSYFMLQYFFGGRG